MRVINLAKFNGKLEFSGTFPKWYRATRGKWSKDTVQKLKERIVYVNCYRITRHYGGAEEGGWYYNRAVCYEVIPVQAQYAEQMKELTEKKHKERYERGNIYSVLGGVGIEVVVEDEPKESEYLDTPHYE